MPIPVIHCLGAGRMIPAEKWQEQPEQSNQPESQNPQDLPINEPNLGRNQLERLKHKEEVPLGLDSGWRRYEWIGFDA